MHYGIVERGVELLAEGFYLSDAHAGEDVPELGHYHLDALAVGLVAGGLLQGPRQVVVDGQELRHRVGAHVLIYALALLGAALAVVVVFGEQAEVFVLFGLEQGLRGGLGGFFRLLFRRLFGLRLRGLGGLFALLRRQLLLVHRLRRVFLRTAHLYLPLF